MENEDFLFEKAQSRMQPKKLPITKRLGDMGLLLPPESAPSARKHDAYTFSHGRYMLARALKMALLPN
jgi:hypothetical protein